MSFQSFDRGIYNVLLRGNSSRYIDPIGYYSSRKKKKTEPMIIDQVDQFIIRHMTSNSSVFKIEQNDFGSTALGLGIKLKLNNSNATKELIKEANDIWMEEIKCSARKWYLSFGLIPYSIDTEFNSKFRVPRIKDADTGDILVYYDIREKKPKYLWISKFEQENKSTFKTENSNNPTKYDGSVHFLL